MGLHEQRRSERDALARKVAKMRDELAAYEQALEEAQDVLDNTPEDEPDAPDAGATAGGAGAAHNPTVMVVDNVTEGG